MTRHGADIESLIVLVLILAALAVPIVAVSLFCLLCIGTLIYLVLGSIYLGLREVSHGQ